MTEKWFFITMGVLIVALFLAAPAQNYVDKQADIEHSKAGLQQCSERIVDKDGGYIATKVLWKKECK